ncbi:hypothetical protein SteCoe_10168 [Stentor coeruleus]|uniref:Uncharacterized protein n=1 Tax=Stentor coeruleus TaxID=5963 RepID=A0A1R2CG59_9CILI|nr:hypothetical protein SteCoe_10168 [Stentor coeruleus]
MGVKKWLAIGGLIGLSSFLIYHYRFKPKCKLQTLIILNEKKLIEIFGKIKTSYREAFKKHQKIFRNGRRKLQRSSMEYENFVYESYANIPKVFNDTVDEVLKDLSMTREIFDDSWKLLKNEESVFDAYADMKTITPTGYPRNELQMETIRDALEFCKEKLGGVLDSTETLQLAVSLLEDDLKDRYGFEIEDIERAYCSFMDNFNDYDSVFQAIREAKSVMDV